MDIREWDQRPSLPFWKGMKQVGPIFKSVTLFIPGNRNMVCFWLHDWGCGILKYNYPVLFSYVIHADIKLSSALQSFYDDMPIIFRENLSTQATSELTKLKAKLRAMAMVLIENRTLHRFKH